MKGKGFFTTLSTLNLGKIYEGKEKGEALEGVNLSIGKGALLLCLDPTGARKTTFLRIISTQLIPSKGFATVLECRVMNYPSRRAQIHCRCSQDMPLTATLLHGITPNTSPFYEACHLIRRGCQQRKL